MNTNHVGVVGLGGMGKALAESLIAAEHAVAAWDRHTDRVATTAMIGAAPTMSPQQLAEQSDVIFLTLPNPTAVREVLYDEDAGLLCGLRDGAVIIDMTTGDAGLAHEVAARVEALGRGIRYVDAPVSGTSPNLTVMVGGEPGSLGAAEEPVNDVSDSIIYTGGLGRGFTTKLVHQHVKYATHLAAAEALIIAEKAGLDVATTLDAIQRSSGVAGGLKGVAEYFTGNRRAVAKHAPATTIAKDMHLASAVAEAAGVTSATLAAATDFFDAAIEGDYAKRPYPESTELLSRLRSQDA